MQTGTMRLRELTIKYSLKKSSEDEPVVIGRIASRPSEVVPALMQILHDEPAEVFAILCLTTKYRVIAYHEVSRLIQRSLNRVKSSPERYLRTPPPLLRSMCIHQVIRHHRPMISMSPDDSPRLAGCLAWNCWITSSSATGATAASGKWAAFDARGLMPAHPMEEP